MKNLKEEFDFIELEDRLEMVQFVVAEAACNDIGNNSCSIK